jgi:6-phosphogluconate dehydrogenase
MRVAMIGLGRMGSNMARRLMRHGHEVVTYDRDPNAVATMAQEGAIGASSPAALSQQLASPRVIWMMVPDHVVDDAIASVAPHLGQDDVIVDGGNSRYQESARRAEALKSQGIHFVDVGTSGGVWGLERGYSLMIGGSDDVVRRLTPLFAALAPGGDGARPAQRGFLHCGPNGAGHFVKMVHNAIEYGLMQAYAEGFNVLEKAPYELNLPEIAEVWRHGSVVESWLLDLTAAALAGDPTLGKFEGRVGDSGEGRWTVHTAVEAAVPIPVIAAALFARFSSRGEDSFANRLLSAMRQQFGGHVEPMRNPK